MDDTFYERAVKITLTTRQKGSNVRVRFPEARNFLSVHQVEFLLNFVFGSWLVLMLIVRSENSNFRLSYKPRFKLCLCSLNVIWYNGKCKFI